MSHTILGHCDLDRLHSFKNFCVRSISLIFFEVGIPNFCVYASWDRGVSLTILGSM